MTAHALLIDDGPGSAAVCEECDWRVAFPSTIPAMDVVRAHNRARHAYPEQQLEIGES